MGTVTAGRILLVAPEGTESFTAAFLQKLDHPVTTCRGPDPGARCPLLDGRGCPSYDAAHGIVFSLDLALPAHRAILRRYADATRGAGRDLPIRVVVPQGSSEVDGVVTWAGEPSVADLDGFAALVEAADRFS